MAKSCFDFQDLGIDLFIFTPKLRSNRVIIDFKRKEMLFLNSAFGIIWETKLFLASLFNELSLTIRKWV